jgi:hypothetical protein
LILKEEIMKVTSQRSFPVVLNKPREHIEVPVEGTLVKFYWNIGLLTREDRFLKMMHHEIEQLIIIEVFSYGRSIARYCNKWREGYDDMSALYKKGVGFSLTVNDMVLRMIPCGKMKERKIRGHTGDPLIYPDKIAIQRLQQ